jgi:uncharacterized protein (DUF983 family)
MSEKAPHRNYLSSILSCRCPRCREGKLFIYPMTFRLRKNTAMHDKCPACGQPTDIEVGFYYGTGYVSYLLGLLITIISFLIWLLIIGFSFKDKRFLFWISFNSALLILMQPWLMRFSRALWLSFFVKYDPYWQLNKPEDPERIIESEMNNW